MIKVEVIKASRNPEGVVLWTIALTYPRFIHAELMTHRLFSRNASSSRAVPIIKMLRAILRNSAAPVSWGSHKAGMQAGEDLTGIRKAVTKFAWNAAKYCAVAAAWIAMKAGAHKQVVNRMTEPWSHITVLVSTTDWANWDALRDHEDADPTIHALAKQIVKARMLHDTYGRIQDLKPGQWHLPYVTDQELNQYGPVNALKMSTARCARVSYLTHGGEKPVFDNDVKLYERLALHEPKHASPLEHQATPDTVSWQELVRIEGKVRTIIRAGNAYDTPEEHGNFYGFCQHRKTLPNEAVLDHERIM